MPHEWLTEFLDEIDLTALTAGQLKAVAGAVALWCAGLASLGVAVDWLLPARTTAAIKGAVESIWIRLNDLRIGRVILLAARPMVFRAVLVVICGALVGLCTFIIGPDLQHFSFNMPFNEVTGVLFGFVPGVALSSLMLGWFGVRRFSSLSAWIVRRNTPASTLLRSLCVVSASILPLAALGTLSSLAQEVAGSDFGLWLTTALLGVAAGPVLVCYWVMSVYVAWLCTLAAVAAALAVLEFFLLRLAENPKGPVVAASALLGAVGGVLKYLGS